MIIGYKEDGVCHLIRTIGDMFRSNVVAPLSLYGTYTRCLLTGSGPAIIMAEGLQNLEQTMLCDPALLDPKEKITETYLHDVVRPHVIKLLKKRRQLGDKDELSPNVDLLVVVRGIFYHLSISDGAMLVDDRFYCSNLAESSALFGVLEAKQAKGWDLLEQTVKSLDLIESPTLYPLVRVDDQSYSIEFKASESAAWEVCPS
jgi:hypothetical protein